MFRSEAISHRLHDALPGQMHEEMARAVAEGYKALHAFNERRRALFQGVPQPGPAPRLFRNPGWILPGRLAGIFSTWKTRMTRPKTTAYPVGST